MTFRRSDTERDEFNRPLKIEMGKNQNQRERTEPEPNTNLISFKVLETRTELNWTRPLQIKQSEPNTNATYWVISHL